MNNAERRPVPVTILSGFLGAGKTTLLNHILHGSHGLKIAVLVNDFGAINIDAQLVVGVKGETINLANGCICCTIRGDLLKAVVRLLRLPEPPEYILVETSGVSDPVAVANTFLMPEVRPLVHLESLLVVVDTDQLLSLEGENYDLAFDQIAVADIVVLNKVDLATQEQLAAIRESIQTEIPEVRILETTYGQVPQELVLGLDTPTSERVWQRAEKNIHVHGAEPDNGDDHEHHHEHDHDHEHEHDHSLVFSTWSWETGKPLALKPLRRALQALPTSIYRVKGVVYLDEAPENRVILQMVGKRISLTVDDDWEPDETPRTQVVMIASQGGIDPEALRGQLESCIVSKRGQRTALPASTAWTRGI